ncbi:MAG TPA: hypothetical protein VFK89_02620 [Actinomycetota bacterium]|nr:hypothetical protein [Actinomycetota bacterium]
MLLFRSKEHLERWVARGHERGAELTLETQWELARTWFAGRHLPDWKKRTTDEAAAILRGVGLTGDFWSFS